MLFIDHPSLVVRGLHGWVNDEDVWRIDSDDDSRGKGTPGVLVDEERVQPSENRSYGESSPRSSNGDCRTRRAASTPTSVASRPSEQRPTIPHYYYST
ncbi:hypothetical protein [Halalkalicoccus ordinarius]|uniref:hypothetical protein n=1 Tax=Halalkalicoccus ordinarius TaxID=3116651 RepID=UPI00300ECEFF